MRASLRIDLDDPYFVRFLVRIFVLGKETANRWILGKQTIPIIILANMHGSKQSRQRSGSKQRFHADAFVLVGMLVAEYRELARAHIDSADQEIGTSRLDKPIQCSEWNQPFQNTAALFL